jgi:UDP-glucose 4-epimerase
MKKNDVKNLIFSSSATVYGTPEYLPLDENHPTGGCTNPYGKTKYFIEEILKDLSKAEPVSFVVHNTFVFEFMVLKILITSSNC